MKTPHALRKMILGSVLLSGLVSGNSYAQQSLHESSIYMATLHTQQYEAMFHFYANTLDLPVKFKSEGFAEFSAKGLRLSLASSQQLDSMLNSPDFKIKRQGSGVGIGFKLDNQDAVDRLYEALKSKQVNFVSPPTPQPWGEYTAFFRDPDGNIHELVADLPN